MMNDSYPHVDRYGDLNDEDIIDCLGDDCDAYEREEMEYFKLQNRMQKLANISDVFALSVATTSILANAIVIILYFLMGVNRKKIPNFMLFNQAIVDIFLAVYSVFSALPNQVKSLGLSKNIQHFATVTTVYGQASVFLALGILLLISGERFLALYKPLFHRLAVTKCKMTIAILLLWVLSFMPCVVYVTFSNHDTYGTFKVKNFKLIYSVTRIAIVFIGIIIVLVLLFLTSRVIRRSIHRGINRLKMTFKKGDKRRTEFLISENRKESKMVKLFFTMATVYSLSYLPNAFNTMLRTMRVLHLNEYDGNLVDTVVFMLYISSALFDPLLTLTLKDDFRKCLKRRRQSGGGGELKSERLLSHTASTAL